MRFERSRQRKFWMRWRVRTGYPVAVVYLAARQARRSTGS